ncbi:MAG: hypothetical protein HC847_18960 [Hydrococcus sp. RU_2_2]|nr:hypothetical protein [Hydrococcus sp. RU_2_2]
MDYAALIHRLFFGFHFVRSLTLKISVAAVLLITPQSIDYLTDTGS